MSLLNIIVAHRFVVPTHVVTKYQRADGFTKRLSKTPYREFELLMMEDVRDGHSQDNPSFIKMLIPNAKVTVIISVHLANAKVTIYFTLESQS